MELDPRLLRGLVITGTVLIVILLGIVAWITWTAFSGEPVSFYEISQLIQDNNRQLQVNTCILLTPPEERTAQLIAECQSLLTTP